MPPRKSKKAAEVANEEPVQKKARAKIFEIAKGVRHPSHCKNPGVVLTLGDGDTGQLGLGEDILDRSRPAKVPGIPENVVQVWAGGMHTVCLTADGEVYTFGCNDEGALGRDTTEEDSEYTPGLVELGQAIIIQVSAGDSHTAALTADGLVYAWGNFRDASGSIGLTGAGQSREPRLIFKDKPISKITSGSDHIAMLTTDSHIYTFGNGEQGQLGRIAECFATRGGRKGLDVLHQPGLVYFRRQRGVKGKPTFSDVWAGTYTTFGKTDNGAIFAWGLNNYGQLGLSDLSNRFVPERVPSFDETDWLNIQSGTHHTIALSGDGRVYSLGRETYGRLGLGQDSGDALLPTMIPNLEECTQIAASSSVSFAVTRDGAVYSWGMGTSKQLGVGDEEDMYEPTEMTGKQLQNRRGLYVSSGGQHTVLLAVDKSS